MAITGMPGKAVLFDPAGDEASATPGMTGALCSGIGHGPNHVRPTASAVPGLDDTSAAVVLSYLGNIAAATIDAIVTDSAGTQTVAPTSLKNVKFIDSTGTVADGAAIQATGYNNRSGVSIANGDRVLGVQT